MPKRKRSQKPTWKRKTRRRTFKAKRRAARRRRFRRGTIKLMRGIVAQRTVAKLRYSDIITIPASTSGTPESYVYRANSLYDPQHALGGHQPLGFDEMMAMYNHYTVIGAKLTLSPLYTAPSTAIMYGVTLAAGPTNPYASAGLSYIVENRNRKYGYVQTSHDGIPKSVTYRFSAKKFFSCKSVVGDASYKGDASNDPTEGAYFHCFHVARDGSTSTTALGYKISITYIAVFTEPKTIAQS